MLINVKTNEQIEEEKKIETKAVDIAESTELITSLSAYVEVCWNEAKVEKKEFEKQLLINKRQIDGIYDPDKLAAIKEFGSSEMFVFITDTKCRNADAWVKDILFPPNEKCWGIRPTPQAEVPANIRGKVLETVTRDVLQGAMNNASQGQPSDPLQVYQSIMSKMPEIEESLKTFIQKKAKEIGVQMEVKINDQLTEGNWYDAVLGVLPDIIMGTGFVKGPILRKQRTKKTEIDPKSSKFQVKIMEKAIPMYEIRPPFNIYPCPGSTGINDGYLFDRIQITPRGLQELIGIPGFDEKEIRLVLQEYEQGSLHDWLDLEIDRNLKAIDKSATGTVNISYSSHKIDCLEFWDAIQGKKLKEWGITKKDMAFDDDLFYDLCVWKIGGHIIKVMFNPDKLGNKPFSKASFEEKSGSFWGRGLPQVIKDAQQAANACGRAIINNVGIGSGPQVERNVDRIPRSDVADNILYPWRVWDVTNQQAISNAPALKFYQPPMVVDKILTVFDRFIKIADEHSGVPAYAHGDVRVGGAGRTASGLSMLMQGAARGIKALIKTIDEKIISPTVERQYYWNIEQKENFGLICDFQIEARGSAAMLAKEQQLTRMVEFAQATANPYDIKLMGAAGRAYIISEIAKQFGLDVDKAFPMLDAIMRQAEQPESGMGMEGGEGGSEGGAMGGQGPAARTLDVAGNPAQGTDMNEFSADRG